MNLKKAKYINLTILIIFLILLPTLIEGNHHPYHQNVNHLYSIQYDRGCSYKYNRLCQDCKEGYLTHEKISIDGEYYVGCIPCPEGCSSCNKEECMVCDYENNYYRVYNKDHYNFFRDGEFDDGEGHINYVHMMEYVCQYCDYEEGFFLEGDSCYKCADAMENCVKCKSGDYCTDCGQDQFLAWDGQCQDNCYMYGLEYFLDSEFVCHKCSEEIEGCLKCVNEHECVECDVSKNLYLKDGVCQVCDTDAGFFINNGKCEICEDYVEGCLNCLDDYYCIECDIQHGYTLSDGECVNCDNQYGTIFFNYQCLECGKFEALQGCLDCSDYQTCTKCDLSEGYILNNNGKCEKCPIENGYFISNYRCLKCDDYMSGCTLCSNSYSCQQCDVENNYYLYYNYCRYCNPSYGLVLHEYYNYYGLQYKCQSCSITLENCSYCEDEQTCTQCNSNLYYLNDGECEECENAIENCQRCDDNGQTCYQCKTRTFIDDEFQCTYCYEQINGCDKCYNGEYCYSCFDGFYLQDGECYTCDELIENCSSCNIQQGTCQTCNEGYYLKNNQCHMCEQQNCQECAYNYSYGRAECQNCESGYIFDQNKECHQCSDLITNCLRCRNYNTCLSCENGYYLDEIYAYNSCYQCPQDNCSVCDGEICYDCDKGYQLVDGNCQKCEQKGELLGPNQECKECSLWVPNCEVCEDYETCYVCSSGYYKGQDYQCHKCPDGCTECIDENNCKECIDPYTFQSVDGECEICSDYIDNCYICDNPIQCQFCYLGYYLSDDTLSCNSCKDNCQVCIEYNQCLRCLDGYTLNDQYQCESNNSSSSSSVDGEDSDGDESGLGFLNKAISLLSVLLVLITYI